METIVNIDFAKKRTINFAPNSIVDEVVQNVENIASLMKGEVPYQRDIGLDTNIIDQPTSKAMMLFQIDLTEQLKKFEPRARVDGFDWEQSDFMNGYLKVKVTIFIDERLL